MVLAGPPDPLPALRFDERYGHADPMWSADSSRSITPVDGVPLPLDAFYLRYADPVFRHCLSRLASVQDAEDATAAVFMVVLEHPWKMRRLDEAHTVPWLMTTANNVMHEQLRGTERMRKLLARLPPPESALDHADVLAETEYERVALNCVRQALDTLADADRRIIELCVIQGMPPAAVAAVDGTPPGTVRSRLSRALARARESYGLIADQSLPHGSGRQ